MHDFGCECDFNYSCNLSVGIIASVIVSLNVEIIYLSECIQVWI